MTPPHLHSEFWSVVIAKFASRTSSIPPNCVWFPPPLPSNPPFSELSPNNRWSTHPLPQIRRWRDGQRARKRLMRGGIKKWSNCLDECRKRASEGGDVGWKKTKRWSILRSSVRKVTEMRSDKRATQPPRTDWSLNCVRWLRVPLTQEPWSSAATVADGEESPAGSEVRGEKRGGGGGPGRLESWAVLDEMEVRRRWIMAAWRGKDWAKLLSFSIFPADRSFDPFNFPPSLSAFKLPLAGPLGSLHNWATTSDAGQVTGKQGGVH